MVYQVEFHSFWHLSTGMAASAQVDKLVIKDQKGLPIIPGKTVKGLLRDAAEQLHKIDSEIVTDSFIKQVFGAKKADDAQEKEVSKYHFTTTQLAPDLAEDVLERKQEAYLYDTFASTRIDINGLAVEQSLREIEVIVPLVLYGEIIGFPTNDSKLYQQLKDTMRFVKRMGTNRHRGLGRCTWSIITELETNA